ncbi:hypothetical protein N7463_001230 [Penicillium fimorum]|uniref:Uncharacterized protein n=1 Tax=Penicillium fimorum TaxID=1882269 RepID=A0A9W9Y807_9EURO|nr:hypothetical protein N7463_001230 [Penicillium fimorum]
MNPTEDMLNLTMQCYSTAIILSTSHIACSSSSSSSFSSSSTFVSSHPSSTTLVSSGTYDSSDSVSNTFSYEFLTVHTSEGFTSPLRQGIAERDILGGISQLAVMIDHKDDLDENRYEERDRLASGIEDAKVLLGLHLCRIEDDLTRQVLLETFLLHLGSTDAPWMLAPLLARLARGI